MASTKTEVEKQSTRDRAWEALETAYNRQIDASNAEYTQARSTSDNQALSRGMGRSSYNQQVLANIDAAKVDAANALREGLIAAYQDKVTEIEEREEAYDQWAQEFEENKRQYNETLAETIRSNKATEAYNYAALDETIRSNKENEYINWAKIDAEYGDHSSGSSGSSGSSSRRTTTTTTGDTTTGNTSGTSGNLFDRISSFFGGNSNSNKKKT